MGSLSRVLTELLARDFASRVLVLFRLLSLFFVLTRLPWRALYLPRSLPVQILRCAVSVKLLLGAELRQLSYGEAIDAQEIRDTAGSSPAAIFRLPLTRSVQHTRSVASSASKPHTHAQTVLCAACLSYLLVRSLRARRSAACARALNSLVPPTALSSHRARCITMLFPV